MPADPTLIWAGGIGCSGVRGVRLGRPFDLAAAGVVALWSVRRLADRVLRAGIVWRRRSAGH